MDLSHFKTSAIPTFDELLSQQAAKELADKKAGLIFNLIRHEGLDPNDMILMNGRVTCVHVNNDPFEHYWLNYGTPEAKRLISVERFPDFSYTSMAEKGHQINLSLRYY